MEQTPNMSELMRLAQSPAGQQLLKLLQSTGGDNLRSALAQAGAGDMTAAKNALAPLLSSPQAQALLKQLEDQR